MELNNNLDLVNECLKNYSNSDNIPYTIDTLKRDIICGKNIPEELIYQLIWNDLPEIAECIHEEFVDYYKREALKFYVIRMDNQLYGIVTSYNYDYGTEIYEKSFAPVKPTIDVVYNFI